MSDLRDAAREVIEVYGDCDTRAIADGGMEPSIERLTKALEADGGGDVEDRLPDVNNIVLVYYSEVKDVYGWNIDTGYISSAYKETKLKNDEYGRVATHWMPLPSPPKEKP